MYWISSTLHDRSTRLFLSCRDFFSSQGLYAPFLRCYFYKFSQIFSLQTQGFKKSKQLPAATEWLFEKDIFKSLDHIVKKKSDQRVTHHHRTSMCIPHCNSKAFRMRFQIGPKYIHSVLTENIKTRAKKNLQQCHLAARPLHLRLWRKNDEETSEKWRQKNILKWCDPDLRRGN